MQITATFSTTFTADNDCFCKDLEGSIRMSFDRACESAIKDMDKPSRNGETHAYPIRDSNGNTIGAVTVHHG